MKATLDDAPFNEDPNGGSDLFARACRGDQRAASALYDLTVPRLRSWLSARFDGDRASDIAHDAMAAAFARSARFQPGAAFHPWVSTIARRLALNSARDENRRRRRERDYFDAAARSCRAGSNADTADLLAALQQQIARLPASHQNLLRRRFSLGHSVDEIAASAGRRRGAVAVCLHRICRRLRARLLDLQPSSHSFTASPTQQPAQHS